MHRIPALLLILILPQEGLGDLDSPDPAAARKAFEAAIRGGDEKALEEGGKTSERARLALAEVRAHKKFADAYPEARICSLDFRDKPFGEALSELSRILGVRIEKAHDPHNPFKIAERVTCSFRDCYLLEALHRFSEASKMKFRYDGGVFRYYAGPDYAIKRSYWRHFALSVNNLSEVEMVASTGERTRTVNLSISILTDGATRIAGSKGTRFTQILEKPDRSLLPKTVDRTAYFGFWYSQGHIFTGGEIGAPSTTAEELSIVSGTVDLLLPEGPRFQDLPLVGDIREVKLENLVLRAERSAPDGSEIKVTGRVADLKKPHLWPIPADFQLREKDGRLLEASGTVSGAPDAPSLILRFNIPAGFKPSVLRVRGYESFGALEVPFEFREVRIR